MKKHHVLSAALLAGLLCFGCSSADSDTIKIALCNESVTIGDKAVQTLTEGSSRAVYISSAL